MENFKQSRRGFRFEVANGEPVGNKRKAVVFDINYLAGSVRKGVLATIRNIEIEQAEGYTVETSTLFGDGNCSAWVKVLARKNDKEVVRAAEALDSKAPAIVNAFLESADNGKAALLAAIAEMR